jgi:hypothetical protein
MPAPTISGGGAGIGDERPRKTLAFCSPAEKFNECVASIH